MIKYSMVWSNPQFAVTRPNGFIRTLLWQLYCWSLPEAARPLPLGGSIPPYTLSGMLIHQRNSKY